MWQQQCVTAQPAALEERTAEIWAPLKVSSKPQPPTNPTIKRFGSGVEVSFTVAIIVISEISMHTPNGSGYDLDRQPVLATPVESFTPIPNELTASLFRELSCALRGGYRYWIGISSVTPNVKPPSIRRRSDPPKSRHVRSTRSRRVLPERR